MDTFGSLTTLRVGGVEYRMAHLGALEKQGWSLSHLPYSLRILLENLLRREDGSSVTAEDIETLARWSASDPPDREIAFMPARVLLQDFTGVPALVDLSTMRDAVKNMGGDPTCINPVQPVELVIDHSVQVDEFGSNGAFHANVQREFQRNGERYAFLRWGQTAFQNFKVVPPGTGIIHQINLEYLARVAMVGRNDGIPLVYPDTLVGTDSHTTMINGLGVLGWGVGGIEAEAAMLGQPLTMLIPRVVGCRLHGELPEGTTATDLVLCVTELLRNHGVVGKFVEFYGPGMATLQLADRATLSNMGPEYGATCGIFPVDNETLEYLRFSGRSPEQVALVEAYVKEQGLFRTEDTPDADYSEKVELDLATVEPSLAGPSRPQDRLTLEGVKRSIIEVVKNISSTRDGGSDTFRSTKTTIGGEDTVLQDGAVAIAAITSCTNTSNPSVMVAAGLVARKAIEKGLTRKPWVKTSLAPGSRVVTDYLNQAGLTPYLDKLGFQLVGYGCTTCIGNSGPLIPEVGKAFEENDLVLTSVLSGNRNFDGRVHAQVRANYLASPPLVVAYALAGTTDIDLSKDPLGTGADGNPVFLRDIWPSQKEVADAVKSALRPEMFRGSYARVFEGDETWKSLDVPSGTTYPWEDTSTYVKAPPFFSDMPAKPGDPVDLFDARALAVLGDSVTTDHISPAGAFPPDSPAGRYLQERGVEPVDFNSYGSRRGNHEVMMRGTFANVRLRNLLVPGVEGGETVHIPSGDRMSIFEASEKYRADGVPLIVLAGKEYGTGSSRDWAAKGPRLLGVRAVIAQSFERIHRSNLVGMGIAPLQFMSGDSVESLNLTGHESFAVVGLAKALKDSMAGGKEIDAIAKSTEGNETRFRVTVRLDTPQEMEYYRHGGILQYVLRQLMKQ